MPIYKVEKDKLTHIREQKIEFERDIQQLTEKNLDTLLGLEFVSTEFSLHQLRIDTLAYDKENSAFVIIEYKRDRSFSVIDQGYAYLALMLNNKADFILEYNEKTGGNLKRDDVDWSQTRVLFFANSFTSYQMNAINFRDLPIELWEVKIYDNNTILYNQLLAQEAKESIKTVSKNKTISSVSKEVKVYNVEDHLVGVEESTKNLFYGLKEKIFSIKDDIEERPKQNYIAYRTQQAFAYVHLQKNRIKIHLIISKDKLNDPKNISRDVTNIGHHGGGVTEIYLDKEEDLNYIFSLIEQSYKYLLK